MRRSPRYLWAWMAARTGPVNAAHHSSWTRPAGTGARGRGACPAARPAGGQRTRHSGRTAARPRGRTRRRSGGSSRSSTARMRAIIADASYRAVIIAAMGSDETALDAAPQAAARSRMWRPSTAHSAGSACSCSSPSCWRRSACCCSLLHMSGSCLIDGVGLRLPGIPRGRAAAGARRFAAGFDLPAVLPRRPVPARALRAVPVLAAVRGRDPAVHADLHRSAAEWRGTCCGVGPVRGGVCA